jgi:hypothetical protein
VHGADCIARRRPPGIVLGFVGRWMSPALKTSAESAAGRGDAVRTSRQGRGAPGRR